MMRQNLEARNLAGIPGRLALGVVEISRNGDDRLRDRASPR